MMKAVYISPLEKAELAKLGQADLNIYENSLKVYRDLKNVIDTAYDDGKIEGEIKAKNKEKIKIAKKLKENKVAINIIMMSTGLSETEINKL